MVVNLGKRGAPEGSDLEGLNACAASLQIRHHNRNTPLRILVQLLPRPSRAGAKFIHFRCKRQPDVIRLLHATLDLDSANLDADLTEHAP